MDNICHTLVGAAIGESGLKTRTRCGNATLMIAANLPDIDVAIFATGQSSLAFRRGITHGVLAQCVLPLVLAAVMWRLARRPGASTSEPSLGWMVVLSYLGVFSHVGLDWLNTYGIRLLMPFSERWFYGDAVFIVDPWLWVALSLGVWLTKRRASPRPARVALALALLYVVLMVAGTRAARDIVWQTWASARGAEPVAVMVGPRPVWPLSREIVVETGDRYATGTFTWWPRSVRFDEAVEKNDRRPEVADARRDPGVQDFLTWSRFPVWTVVSDATGATVTLADMRFSAVRRVLGGARFEVVTRVGSPPPR